MMASFISQYISVLLFLLFFGPSTLSSPEPHFPASCRHDFVHILSCRDEKTNTEVIGISDDLLNRFALMADFAAAAYCPGNNDSPNTSVTCPPGNCDLVEAAHVSTTAEFQNTKETDNTGYLAIDDVHKMVVLAFRGSVSKANWDTDWKMRKTPTGWCEDCNVHQGFWQAWNEVRNITLSSVETALANHLDYEFVIVGHSLGGAIATLAAGDFRQIDEHYLKTTSIQLYTFGSPRIGNAQLASFLSQQSPSSWRITAIDDPVPRMPGAILGYMHTSPEYWVSRDPDAPAAHDVHVLTGLYNSRGNSGTHWWKAEHHRHYFGRVSLCAPEEEEKRRKRVERGWGDGTAPMGEGWAWDLVRPFVNMSMVVREGGGGGAKRGWNVTFPVGSVGDEAAEAVYGPKGENGEEGKKDAATVMFGQDE